MRISLPHLAAHAAPLACAVHCLAAPLLAASVPLLAAEGAEWGFHAAAAIPALALAAGAYRWHRRPAPLLAAFAAVTAWTLSLAGAFAPLPEAATTVAACTGLAAASVWGARLRHRVSCDACGCAAHGEEDGR
jgi:hypothetical protein